MATTYATVDELKTRITVNTTLSTTYLQQLLDAAAETVDDLTRGYRPPTSGGTVYEAFSASASETRLFDDDLSGVVLLDDCLTVTAITRNGQAITSDYYKLDPANELPKTRLLLRSDAPAPVQVLSTWYGVPYPTFGAAQLAITGTWGYCTQGNRPAAIKEATLMIAEFAYESAGANLADKMNAVRNVGRDIGYLVDRQLRGFKRNGGYRIV